MSGVERSERRLHLGISVSSAWTGGTAWRRPDSRVEDLNGAPLFIQIAQDAERAGLDFVFRADGLHLDRERLDRHPGGLLDPVPILAAIAATTSRIGLVGTASTSFDEPYNLARAFGTLDLVSEGRAGWNIVTSQVGERNYGQEEVADHEERYARAEEFVDTVRELWGSWPRESILIDRENGRYADTSRIRPIDHHGRFFDVEGPLNIPTSAQGAPVLFQAGASERGRAFAGTHADAVFAATADESVARELTSDLHARATAAGRPVGSLAVLPGAHLYIADTDAQAQALYREIRADDDIVDGYERLERTFGIDFRGLGLDDRVPAEFLPAVGSLRTSQTHAERFRALFVDEGLTLRTVIRDHVLTGAGHWRIVGSPEQVADAIAHRFLTEADDGNVFIPGAYPETFRLFFEAVVPLLKDRRLFRREYEGTTLREHLGIRRPALG
ncbi:hypothetical protein GCM10025867_36560 [Frondihabitans sucicola]|uniref:Luciferase-like domain-containing protein n=1 Tax=Frondihabitans sucicola TaxID=1268041 RepID=A0ABM8GSH4_9MICO|nr:NtaA/DmoA family FMN-dependent monooxygenase [Frondihabitans sucicola]BDZ51415.1 hypothetical protein GCM10025867_36560 [Frondihabitans sucicola]